LSETSEHKKIKELVTSRLKDWFGCSIDEYPQSGHELDVYAITSKGVRIYVEIIWSPTKGHFLADLLSIEHAETNVKLAIASQKILDSIELKRKFEKTVANQRSIGTTIYGEMLNANLFLENSVFLDSTFKQIVYDLVKEASISPKAQLKKGTSLSIGDKTDTIDFDSYLSDLIYQYDNFSTDSRDRKNIIEQLSKFNFNRYYVPVLLKDLMNDLSAESDTFVARWLSEDRNGLFITGDFGTGKSTLCVHIAYLIARQRLNDKESRIPIFISLRNIDEICKESILAETNKVFKISWDYLQQLSTDGKLVFILDGFDEIPERTDWKKTLSDFDNIVKLFCHGKSKVIVSCRTHFFKKDSEIWGEDTELMKSLRASENFNIFSTVSFSKEQTVEFIKKHTGNWEEIWTKIKETYNLLELTSRPLLTEMIVSTISKIVSSRGLINEINLYDKYTEDWINRDDWRSSLKPLQKARLMERLAFRLLCQDKYSIQFSEIKQIIETEFGVKEESAISDYYDYDIRTCSFFRRDTEGNYSFMHKSFLEYFVARKIASDLNQQKFMELGKKLFSNEIVFFLAKLLNASVETTLMDAIKFTKKRSVEEYGIMGGNALKILEKIGKTKFVREDFSYCRFQGISVICEFWNCNFSGTVLRETEFESTKFVDCVFQNIEGILAVFDNCLLEKGELTLSMLTNAQFKNTEFKDIDVNSTKFVNSEFKNTSFKECTLKDDTFDNCKTNYLNLGTVIFIDCKLGDCTFVGSDLPCSIFSKTNLSGLTLTDCDLSGSCFFTCTFENAIIKNVCLAFSSILNCKGQGINFLNNRLYKLFASNSDNVVPDDFTFEASRVAHHEVGGKNVKINPHTPVLCELDKAVRKLNIDTKIEEKTIANYGLFWDVLKIFGKSSAMATSFYATLKTTKYPRSLNEISVEFNTSTRIIAENYRKLLAKGYVEHIRINPKELIEVYANELKITKNSEILAKAIFDSAKKNRLPQGRNNATYATACLCLACKKNGEKITCESLATLSKLSTGGIRNCRDSIRKHCDKLLISED
jgi:uncharacterized protein YjbI with pentapeptide repeats